jgi:hypothetical protein
MQVEQSGGEMELFDLSTLVADRRASREGEARRERLWRRRRRPEPMVETPLAPAFKQARVVEGPAK